MGTVFGFDPPEEGIESFKAILETERTVCAFDGTEMVGTAGAFSLDMTVPGGSAPVAGTTMVTVLPTHRRRGALRQMMEAHLQDARERGEMLAALWASESTIYARFGYGPAATMVDAEIDRRHAQLRDPDPGRGEVRLVDVDEARQLLPRVFDETRLLRAGMFDRSAAWWENRVFRDPESHRNGASSYRYAVYEEDAVPRGYVQYRAKEEWDDDGFPQGEIRVTDLQTVDLAALAAIWRYLTSVDLITRIARWNSPVDDPLPWLLEDGRRLRRRLSDSLWVCPVDIPRALATRRYSQEGRVVLAVHDRFNPPNNGSYLLEGGREGAACAPTAAEPDVRLDAADLGSIYLGGVRLLALAAAGRVEGSPDALRRADAMFTWHPAPWCQDVF